MSGTGPESIPVSADPRSKRPTKKRALSPASQQASQLEGLFKRPDQEIRIPAGGPDPKRRLPLPPEIVTNVQGSSAGAGSGEFHVYKAARRREYERLRIMDEEVRNEEEQRLFEDKKAALEDEDTKKTERNRAKREKMRARKEKAKLDKKKGGEQADGASNGGDGSGGGIKARPVQPRDVEKKGDAENGKTDMDSHSEDTAKATTTDAPGLVIHEDD